MDDTESPITEPTLTARLARFTADCRLADVPPEVVERMRMFVLDYLGVALTGVTARSSEIISDVVAELGGRETCTVIGRDYRSNALLAALVNGTTGHAVEMDDDHRTSVLHPAVAVIPAAIAAAELVGATGEALLEGVIAGYEAMIRIGDAFLGTQYYEGFHPTGSCGVFGAAAAAGRVFGLPIDQLIAAFGIAGTQAAGLEEWKADGSWIKRLHPGKSAESGLLAVMLARRGYTGPATILEGSNGFLKAFSFERKWDIGKITEGLGSEYRAYGTSFKPFAGCRFFHQVIDATLALVREHDIKATEVEEVVVRIYNTAYLTLFQPEQRRYQPGTNVDAQFSIPYAVAAAILHGPLMPIHYSDEAIRDPTTLELCRKVKGVPDDEYEKAYPNRFPTEVTIRVREGGTVSAFCDLPSGDPENPIYAEPGRFEREIREKFRALLALQPDYRDRCEDMIDQVSALEKVTDLSVMMRLFTPLGHA